MQTIEISYDPYKLVTKLLIDGMPIENISSDVYRPILNFIENKVPLQTWIEPVADKSWGGLLDALADSERTDEIEIHFSGRTIDFNDLKYALDNQNAKREADKQIRFTFKQDKILDDRTMADGIEKIVCQIKSPRFKALIDQRSSVELKGNYDNFEENYKLARNKEFQIAFIGTYSSGKSTLINVLMRHDVLPSASTTCTSKNCLIRHNSQLGERISVTAYNKNSEEVSDKRVFDTDEACKDHIQKLMNNSESAIPDVDYLELEVNLSHLYPNQEMEKQFTIVLADTPGMDSGDSEKNGINEHKQIALKQLQDASKPIAVFCIDAEKSENENIGSLMPQILAQSVEDGKAYNDRYLFLMNKAERGDVASSIEEHKKKFFEYLTTPEKWKIDNDWKDAQGQPLDKEQIKKTAANFVPRIFVVSALAAKACLKRADTFTNEKLKANLEGERALKDSLESFKKALFEYEDSNYRFIDSCSIPAFIKKDLSEKYQQAITSDDQRGAVWFQTGIPCLESAIQDYITRYAYPIKVRALLETFDDILADVKAFSDSTLVELEKRKTELGEEKGEQKEAKKRKNLAEKKQKELQNAKEKCAKHMTALQDTKFDSARLERALDEFRANVETNNSVKKIRICVRSNEGKMPTGQKSDDEVSVMLNQIVKDVETVFKKALEQFNEEVSTVNREYEQQLQSLLGSLSQVVSDLQRSGTLQYGAFDFRSNLTWKKISNFDYKQLRTEIKKHVISKSTKIVIGRNKKKQEYRESWNPFKKIASLFMEDYVSHSVPVDGYVDVTEINQLINNWQGTVRREGKTMEQSADGNFTKVKTYITTLGNTLLSELELFQNDILERQARLDQLSQNIDELNKAIQESQGTCAWLNDLTMKMQGE